MILSLEGSLGNSGNERLVGTCMASMPTLKAHKNTISCGKIGASSGREAKQGIGYKVGWFGVLVP
jgi:hypothetical protein